MAFTEERSAPVGYDAIKRETEVDAAVDELRREVKKLQEATSQLGPRLTSVCRESTPPSEREDKAMRGYSTPLANDLQVVSGQVADEVERIMAVINRLEV